jgi:hypothetical protein
MNTTSRNFSLGSMQLFVASVGAVGNLLVILVIFRNRTLLRNIHYYFVLHLAICDFFNLVFSTSYIFYSFTGSSMMNYSSVLCKLWDPTHTTFYIAGVFFLIIISIFRYQAVSKPFEPAMCRWKVKVMAMFAYILAIICILPYILVLQFNNTSGCVEKWPEEQLNICYTLVLAAVQYFIPVVLLSMLYWKICSILVRQNRKMKLLCASAAASEQQKLSPYQRFRQYRNARTFLVCVAIVVCFAVTALPMQIMFFLSISNIIEFPRFYWWFEVVHNFGVSAVNPFIYGTLDRKLFSSSIRRLRKILHV